MATATVTTDLTEITDCDSTTAGGTWSGITATLGSTDPAPLEGTGRLGSIVKQISDTNTITFTPTSPIDMSGSHLRLPIQTVLKPLLRSKATGGIQLIITGSTSGVGTFNVSGGDFYTGGWEVLVCDPYGTPDSGTQVVGNIESFSMNFQIPTTAAKNIITTQYDWISYGTGLKAYGGTSTSDTIDMAAIDTQDVYYLLLELRKGVYRLSGKFQLGDDVSTNNCYFNDSGQIIMFEQLEVASDLYEIKVIGNATGTTNVNLSGNFITTEGPNYIITMTDATNVDAITLDGTIIQKAGDFFGSSVVSGNGTVFDTCGMLEPGASTLTNFTVKNGTETAALDWPSTVNLSNGTFISSGTGYAITGFPVADDYTITGMTYSGYAATDGSTGNECIYVEATTGTVNLLISGGDTPTIHSAGATVNVINSVDINVYVKDTSNAIIEGAAVAVYKTSDDTELMNELTVAVTGLATETFNYVSDTDVYIRVRKSSTGTRYSPVKTTGTITSSGLTLTVVLNEDTNI